MQDFAAFNLKITAFAAWKSNPDKRVLEKNAFLQNPPRSPKKLTIDIALSAQTQIKSGCGSPQSLSTR
jgi:hypothetical protein